MSDRMPTTRVDPEQVRKIRTLSILKFISEVVISRVRFIYVDNFDMAPRDLHPA